MERMQIMADLLDRRRASIDAVVEHAAAVDEAQEKLTAATNLLHEAVKQALKAGWTETELDMMNLPSQTKPRRPRRKRKPAAKPQTATSTRADESTKDEEHGAE